MGDTDLSAPALVRVPTGIVGLDTITRGGFFQGGVYLVVGEPGTGKTILGNQLCFQHLARGGRALYITVMAESHARMFAHLQSQAFFELAQVGEQLKYFSAFSALEKEGLDGLSRVCQTGWLCRVAGRRYRRPAPSERHVRVSPHAAQASLTPSSGRGFLTSNPWLWICR